MPRAAALRWYFQGMGLNALLPGNTYELETTVQRRGKPYTIVSKGRFQCDSSRTVITLASKDENARLRIGPGTSDPHT